MKHFAMIAAAATIALTTGTSAFAACNRDTGTETALGAGSGALVGGLASNSIGGALIGGVAGGVIGHTIGSSNNRDDCARERRAYRSEQRRDRDSYYLDRDGRRHYYYR